MATVKKGVVVIYTNVTARIIAVMDAVMDGAVITSGREGNHSDGSRHYVDHALDCRGRHLTDERRTEAVEEMQSQLGPQFYVEESNDGAIHAQLNKGEVYVPAA